MSYTLTFGLYTKNLQLCVMEPATKFNTEFVDPTENTNILKLKMNSVQTFYSLGK